MKNFLFVSVLITMVAMPAFAAKPLQLTASTDYKQTVWTGLDLPRLHDANVLPANPEVASALEKLDFKKRYVCQADYYLGSVGYFNAQNEKGILMLYSLSGCKAQ
ncbi:MAG TPA: hypothetical protein VJB59_14810 [Bdellovibrionota bacterium]|nr:hypothetical protein [Bdellovibrionota bacterium]